MRFKVCYSFVTGDHHSNQFSSEEDEVIVEADSSRQAIEIVEKNINRTVISVEKEKQQ